MQWGLLSSENISPLLTSPISPPFSSLTFRDNLLLMMTDPGEGDAIKAALKEIIMIIVEMINPANPKWNNVHDDQVSALYTMCLVVPCSDLLHIIYIYIYIIYSIPKHCHCH